MELKAFDCLVAEEFQAIAPFDQCDAFGRQALQFDGSHFRAVLLALALALRLFVIVELTVGSVCGAVKEVDCRPEQIWKVWLEPGVVQCGDQGVENVGNGASDRLTFGQRSRIGLVVEWTVAKELQFVENEVGRR
ncbi:hypothetical protein BBta_1481 [Bradyrhizobium sp. BTAi1]|nr:hypothetical protein BBta_1481 [Bradyrhizobium sp. BTAi1]